MYSNIIPFSLPEVINLADNNLEGTLPANLASYAPSLMSLVLNLNTRLTGPLPSLIGLRDLTRLEFQGTSLTGTLPTDGMADLGSLEYLNFNGVSGISGPLPSTLGFLTNLKLLDIQDTAISGTLPEAIGTMFSLGMSPNMQRLDS